MNQKGISSIVIILIIIGVLVVGGGIYWWQSNNINHFINQWIFRGAFNLKGCDIYINERPACDNDLSQKSGQSETANWKTYRNEKYGLEVKYPEKTNYEIKYYAGNKEQNKTTIVISNSYGQPAENADSVAIGWGPNSFFDIDFIENPTRLSIIDFIENDIDKNNPNSRLSINVIKSSGENYSFNNREAYEFKTVNCCLKSYKAIDGEQRFIYFKYDNDTIGRIVYHITNPLDNYDQEHKLIFDQILSTFKFIK